MIESERQSKMAAAAIVAPNTTAAAAIEQSFVSVPCVYVSWMSLLSVGNLINQVAEMTKDTYSRSELAKTGFDGNEATNGERKAAPRPI